MNDVTIVIPVFGDIDAWLARAIRAARSARTQTLAAADVVVSQAATLSEARNRPAFEATTEFLIFLDADDELDPGYVEAMLAGSGDLRQPSTLGITDGVEDDAPMLLPARPLMEGNHIVIGAAVRRELFVDVGGFDELPMYEDWSLWLRCWLSGATISACPDAIYRVHVSPGSRNNTAQNVALRTYHIIRNRYLPEARAKGLA